MRHRAKVLLLTCLFSLVRETLTDLQIEKELEIALDVNDVKNSPYYKDKVLSIPITNEAGRELMQHWTDQAFSGLISAIATRRLNLAEKYNTKKHEKCAGKAMDVKSHAKCLVELENDVVTNRWLKRKKYFDQKTRKSIITASAERKLNTFKSLESYGSMDNLKKNRRRTSSELMNIEETPQDWIGSFKTRRAKRSINVKSAASYSLKSKDDMTPFAIVTKHLTDAVKVLKKKDKLSKWQEIIARIRDETSLLKKRKQVEKLQRKRMKIFQKSKKSEESREIRRMPSKRNGISGKFASMEKFIEDEELREMVHQKASNMTEEEELMMIPVDMIRKAVKIGLSLSGHNTSDFEKKTLKLISPRFMSLVPEDEEAQKEEIDLLSPSLFSLHDSGNGIEKNTSFASLLGKGMSIEDSQNFLDLLVEATGVAEAVEDAEQKLIDAQRKKDDAMGRGPDGQPLYFTKENITERFPSETKKIEVFEELDKMYTEDQLREMNGTGYTVLTPKQMQLVYGEQSPYNNSKLLKTYNNMTTAEIHRAIHATIKNVAEEKLKFEVRQKDFVLTPFVGVSIVNDPATTSQAIILSPVLFVPLIQSPAVFGTVILSPWLFVPVILSPRILGPVILNPFLFVPIVLTPLALVPVILSPGVFNPFILSPLLMCPFILSPQVLTPLILTPFCMTPLIGTPLALSPLVLSPFVLSPQVLSPQYVTAFILSPNALSPAVESNGALVTILASPSFLS